MLCTVYRLMEKGVKLPKSAAQATASRVDFTYERHPGRSSMLANLNRQNGAWFLRLEQAEILHIKGGGIMVEGFEASAGSQSFTQRWWCVPLAAGEIEPDDEVVRKIAPDLLSRRHSAP